MKKWKKENIEDLAKKFKNDELSEKVYNQAVRLEKKYTPYIFKKNKKVALLVSLI